MAKVKVQITLEDELLTMVDDYCDRNYMNRSWLISQSLVQLLNQQKLIDSFSNLSLAVREAVSSGKFDDESINEMKKFEELCKMFVSR